MAPDATALERFLPASAPPGFLPASGITTDLNTFADMTGGDFALGADQYAFLQRHTTAGCGCGWARPADWP